MKYIISGRDIRISEVAEDEAVIRKRKTAKAQPRDGEGRFVGRDGKRREKWTRLFVLAKEVGR